MVLNNGCWFVRSFVTFSSFSRLLKTEQLESLAHRHLSRFFVQIFAAVLLASSKRLISFSILVLFSLHALTKSFCCSRKNRKQRSDYIDSPRHQLTTALQNQWSMAVLEEFRAKPKSSVARRKSSRIVSTLLPYASGRSQPLTRIIFLSTMNLSTKSEKNTALDTENCTMIIAVLLFRSIFKFLRWFWSAQFGCSAAILC